ncbi:MAG TPA: methyltransferase domain-containing protein [Cyclobacteriaceae bacterium]|nr:methyltransferase domain-containing protein [Cyclobacteriaceae bacterium]
MDRKLSERLRKIADALPLKEGIRILEIGCGPGALAREICRRIKQGHVLGVDRSPKAIQQAIVNSETELKLGNLSFRQVAIEEFELDAGDKSFDMAVAVRVGALDGRHPTIEKLALEKIAKALTPEGRLFIDGGDPLKEISLEPYKVKAVSTAP